MKVRYGKTEHSFERSMTVRTLLKRLDVVAEGVIVAVNGELVTHDVKLEADDEVEIIRAISGGRGEVAAPTGGSVR